MSRQQSIFLILQLYCWSEVFQCLLICAVEFRIMRIIELYGSPSNTLMTNLLYHFTLHNRERAAMKQSPENIYLSGERPLRLSYRLSNNACYIIKYQGHSELSCPGTKHVTLNIHIWACSIRVIRFEQKRQWNEQRTPNPLEELIFARTSLCWFGWEFNFLSNNFWYKWINVCRSKFSLSSLYLMLFHYFWFRRDMSQIHSRWKFSHLRYVLNNFIKIQPNNRRLEIWFRFTFAYICSLRQENSRNSNIKIHSTCISIRKTGDSKYTYIVHVDWLLGPLLYKQCYLTLS